MSWPSTSRQSRGYGAHWDKLRKLVLIRDAGLCQPCMRAHRTRLGTEVDHIVPKAKGGTDDMDNLQVICKLCHKAKNLEDEGKAPRPEFGRDGEPLGGWS